MIQIVRADGSSLALPGVSRAVVIDQDQVTSHPIEGGVEVADHVHKLPRVVMLSGIVTESPSEDVSSTGGPDRIRQVLEFLDDARGERLTVLGDERIGQVDDLALVRIPVTLRHLRDVPFDLEFRAVKVAEAEVVRLPAAERQASGSDPAVNAGSQATSSSSNTGDDASVLVALFGG